MKKLLRRIMLLLTLSLVLPVTAAELEGVKMLDSLKLANRDLALNGMGLRTRFGLKVYVAGLYVSNKSSDANALIQQPGPKRVAIVMRRNVEADTFLKALRDGISANHNEAQIASLKDRLDKFDDAINQIKDAKQGGAVSILITFQRPARKYCTMAKWWEPKLPERIFTVPCCVYGWERNRRRSL